MSKFFKIDGYFKDDNSQFFDFIVSEFDGIDEENDNDIFFYGLSEDEIKDAILSKEDTMLDFVITEYSEIL